MAHRPSGSTLPEHDAIASTSSEATENREQVASKLVDRFAIWSGVAGLVPLPVVDVLAVGGLQLQMLRRLSQIYSVEFSENRGKALIAALAGCMIPATSGMGAASALKAVPVLNILAAGFVMPVLSAGATFAIGKAFIQHFESGGTLLDFNPPDYREFVKAQKEMWESRSSARRSGSTTATTATTTAP
ncbi:MAG TPA: YcjF family protein [Xanthobacteraceae bacterium]|nr:YcjF family protein [Xanthobacteraceae bacterium]